MEDSPGKILVLGLADLVQFQLQKIMHVSCYATISLFEVARNLLLQLALRFLSFLEYISISSLHLSELHCPRIMPQFSPHELLAAGGHHGVFDSSQSPALPLPHEVKYTAFELAVVVDIDVVEDLKDSEVQ